MTGLRAGGVVTRLSAFVLASFVAAAASAETPRQPTDKWVLNYEDAQCTAYREYGTDRKPLTLVFKAPPVGSIVQLFILQNGPRSDPMHYKANLRVGSRPWLRTSMLVYRNDNSQNRSKLINLPLTEFEAMKGATSFEIDSVGTDYNFALSGVAPLMKALDECLADLRDYWNVSEPSETEAPNPRLSSGAVGDLQHLFQSDDYPRMAARQGLQGTTAVALLIDESGGVADCSVVETSGTAAIDAQSCAIIRERAKFKPAADAAGKPTRSSYYQRVTWKLGL